MPPPLTPAECDLQDFPFMPLHVARLRDSDLAAEEDPEACWYAVLLWAAAWHQVPAASLPNSDAALARFAGLGRDLKTWRKHREGALRGFVLCDDGRLYHPVVAEVANEAWSRREAFEGVQENRTSRQQRWRDRCKALAATLREAGVTPPRGASLQVLEELVGRLPRVDAETQSPSTQASTVDAVEIGKTGTGTGTGTSNSDPNGSGASAAQGDPKKQAWDLGLKALMDRGGLTRQASAQLVGKWAKSHPPERILQAVTGAWDAGTRDPVSYVAAALKRIEGEETDPMRNPEDWRQRRWMAEFVEGRFQWNPDRGPQPGEAGCRVTPEIQREFAIEPAKPQAVRGAA